MVKIQKSFFFVFFLGMFIFLSFFQKSYGAPCSTADPIVITEKKTMTFAEISVGFSGGTIDTSGNVTGDVAAYKGQINNGQVTIEACKNEIINYSFLDGVLTDGTYTMDVTVLTAAGSLTMPASGKYTMDINGRLTVGGLQNPGTYNGSITVVVDY